MGGPLAMGFDFLPRNHDIREDGNSALPRTKLHTVDEGQVQSREGQRSRHSSETIQWSLNRHF